MTEKLFVNIGNQIHLNGKWWCSANGEHCVDVIIPALNELAEENQQLINDCGILVQSNQDYRKENEQLKHSIKCLEADKMELQQYIKRMQGDVE